MTKTFTINKGQKPTEEQLQEVREAKKQPIVFDEDSPELSWQCIKHLRVRWYKGIGKRMLRY